MRDLYRNFETDRVTISDPDGNVLRADIPAQVEAGQNRIMLSDTNIPLVPGCTIARILPSGIVEEYIVEDPGFDQGFLPMSARFTAKVRRKDALPRRPQSTVYVTGPNARVNIGSLDASHNSVVYNEGSQEELFERLSVIASSIESAHRQEILDIITAMKEERELPTFLDRYRDFVSLVADHITMFAPLIPALTALLPHTQH